MHLDVIRCYAHTQVHSLFLWQLVRVLLVCIHMPENVPLVEERTNKMDY